MEKRIQARTNNYSIDSMVRGRYSIHGYGFIEERHFNPDHLFVSLSSDGLVYLVDPAAAKIGPAIYRGDVRGKCDELPMMYVTEKGVRFLYRSKFRPIPANATQTFTQANRGLEERMVREYCSWAGGEYLFPQPHKMIGSHLVYDDGGIRINLRKGILGIEIYAAGTDPSCPVYSFYHDTVRLKFVESEWRYYKICPNGVLEPQDGVTSVVKLATPAKPLMVWAVRVALARVRQLLMDGGYVGADPKKLFESVLDEILKRAAKEDDNLLVEAGDVGHQAHAHVESVIKAILSKNEDRLLELLAKFPEDERAANGSIAAIHWMVAHKVRWVSTERKAYSRDHHFAGTCDGIAYVCSCDDRSCCPVPWEGERLSLIDWKTSNALRISYLWQTAAYQSAIESEDEVEILDRWILRLDKETGEFDPWYRSGRVAFEEDFNGFLSALAMYRNMEKAEDWVSKIRAEKTATKRAIAKELRNAQFALECPEYKEYKGIRKKKCNGTDHPCIACDKKYKEIHDEG